MLELLAPAGSMEALRAAVQNGADAVYLGCGAFNARQSAKNFTPQTLVDAIKYCHVRGVQVHLTLNTLVSDREMTEAAELIRYAAQNNIDAFIVQDLGVVQLCRQIAPGVPIHGSTQMTVHSLPGVLLCAALSASSAVISESAENDVWLWLSKIIVPHLSHEEPPYACSAAYASSSACASWSGHDVGRAPHFVPLTRPMTSSMFMPTTSSEMPVVLPLQPPSNDTLLMVLPSRSTVMLREHVPFVL